MASLFGLNLPDPFGLNIPGVGSILNNLFQSTPQTLPGEIPQSALSNYTFGGGGISGSQLGQDFLNGGLRLDYTPPSDAQDIENFIAQGQRALQSFNTPTPTPILPSGGGGGGQTAEGAILQHWVDLQNEAKKEISDYNTAHPFNYDDYLANQATQQAKATEEPYYQQQLGYYLAGVTNQINKSQTGLQDTLRQLGTSLEDYTHQNQLSTANAIVNANEQSEQSGLGSSGANYRQQGQTQATQGAALQNFSNQNLLQQQQAQHQQGFTLADIINSSNAQQQQLARQNQQDISSLANQLTQRQGQNIAAGLAALPGVYALNSLSGNVNPIAQSLGA